jgi:hypothetical protein
MELSKATPADFLKVLLNSSRRVKTTIYGRKILCEYRNIIMTYNQRKGYQGFVDYVFSKPCPGI